MMIRGVNIGGYLLLERYITPYQFLVTDCHVGLSLPPPQPPSFSSSVAPPYDFCWYPHQLSAPPVDHPHYRECVLTTALAATTTNTTTTIATSRNTADRVDDDDHSKRHEHTTVQQKHCTPVKVRNAFQNIDYPIDERTLALAFIQPVFLDNDNDTSSEHDENVTRVVETGAATANSEMVDIPQQLQRAAAWLDYHLEYFITYDDLVRIQRAHMTHLRVPLPHWILYDPTSDPEEELWIIGKRWEYFLRLCRWARELQLQVWPDIHTAPGSQNGFDNSGQALPYTTCQVWSNNPEYIEKSLRIIETIAQAIKNDGVADVVTGFGLLNEPYADCIPSHYRHFVQEGMNIVRRILGDHMAVYASDMFQANIFNDGHWWIDPKVYHNTYLDSHYYQVFDSTTRYLSPRQHIAYTCQNHYRRTTSCCYSDGPRRNQSPSRGVSRMIGEWSASMDILPSARINNVVDEIVQTGRAPYLDRQLSPERQEFLNNFIQAQIVTYEAADHPGLSRAWFYWTIKMEGGAFQEWDMLRGLQDGWFPNIPADSNVTSESIYGSCYDIMWRTKDNRTLELEEYPDPQYFPIETDPNKIINDDVVLSHGKSLLLHPNAHDRSSSSTAGRYRDFYTTSQHEPMVQILFRHWLFVSMILLLISITILSLVRQRFYRCHKRSKYSRIMESEISMTV